MERDKLELGKRYRDIASDYNRIDGARQWSITKGNYIREYSTRNLRGDCP